MKTITNYELRITNRLPRYACNDVFQKGQVAIIVLLISAVVMTIGLSVSKKTVVETKIDTDEEKLKQAFNAAESGIEYYLKTNNKDYIASDDSSAKIETSNIGGGSATLDFKRTTLANWTTFFWLVGHNSDGSINMGEVYSGSYLDLCSSNESGAFKVDYFYNEGGVVRVWRQGYNLNRSGAVTNYTDIDLTNGCFRVTGLPIGAGRQPLLLAVRPIGVTSVISLKGESAFPTQGQEITSTGKVGNADQSVSQVAKIFNQYRVPVFMLDTVTADNVLSN